MTWFKLDDQGAFHEKVTKAGNEAYGAWCRAGQWSSGHLTEGRIPRSTALVIARQGIWDKLVAARLCHSLGDEGWQIHDFLDWNPRADEVVERRAHRSEAGRIGGLQSGVARRSKREANAKQVLPVSRSKREANAKQKGTPSPSPSPSPSQEEQDPHTPAAAPRLSEADEVWEHYVATLKRHRPRRRPGGLPEKDRKRIRVLLKDFTVEDIKSACTGLFRSSHHLGINDRGSEYLELEYALRKPATFIALADEGAPPADTPAPVPVPSELVDPALIDALLSDIDARYA